MKNPDLKSWPCFSNVPICTLYSDIFKGAGLDYTLGVRALITECWSVEGIFCGPECRYRLLFRSKLSCRQVHQLFVRGLWFLEEGEEGHTQPQTKPNLHTTMSFFSPSLLITHLYPSVHCTALPPRWWAHTRWPTFTSAVHTRCSLEMIFHINLTL